MGEAFDGYYRPFALLFQISVFLYQLLASGAIASQHNGANLTFMCDVIHEIEAFLLLPSTKTLQNRVH